MSNLLVKNFDSGSVNRPLMQIDWWTTEAASDFELVPPSHKSSHSSLRAVVGSGQKQKPWMILTYHKHYTKGSGLITLMRISKFRVGKDVTHMALQVEQSRQTPLSSSVMSWMLVHEGNQVTLPGRRKYSKREGREKSNIYAVKEPII